MSHPEDWRSQLAPASFHYGDTTAQLANFPLQDMCQPQPNGVQCLRENLGAFPVGGVLVVLGHAGYAPGQTAEQALAVGTPTTVNGRSAVLTSHPGTDCSGTGADHDLAYNVSTGAAFGVFTMVICWRGDDPALDAQARSVADSLVLDDAPPAAAPVASP